MFVALVYIISYSGKIEVDQSTHNLKCDQMTQFHGSTKFGLEDLKKGSISVN